MFAVIVKAVHIRLSTYMMAGHPMIAEFCYRVFANKNKVELEFESASDFSLIARMSSKLAHLHILFQLEPGYTVLQAQELITDSNRQTLLELVLPSSNMVHLMALGMLKTTVPFKWQYLKDR